MQKGQAEKGWSLQPQIIHSPLTRITTTSQALYLIIIYIEQSLGARIKLIQVSLTTLNREIERFLLHPLSWERGSLQT